MEKNYKKIKADDNPKFFWKLFLIIFLFSVVVLNWDEVSWIFNPRVVFKGTQEFIGTREEYYDEENNIKISAINIEAPIVLSEGPEDVDYERALKKGVVHFLGSGFPGEEGVAIFLGHSSPPGWPKIDYDWVFTDLEKLEAGDSIEIVFNNKKFNYVVTEKVFLEIGQDVPDYDSGSSEIVLLSCWPPGKNIKRIGVRGVLTK